MRGSLVPAGGGGVGVPEPGGGGGDWSVPPPPDGGGDCGGGLPPPGAGAGAGGVTTGPLGPQVMSGGTGAHGSSNPAPLAAAAAFARPEYRRPTAVMNC